MQRRLQFRQRYGMLGYVSRAKGGTDVTVTRKKLFRREQLVKQGLTPRRFCRLQECELNSIDILLRLNRNFVRRGHCFRFATKRIGKRSRASFFNDFVGALWITEFGGHQFKM